LTYPDSQATNTQFLRDDIQLWSTTSCHRRLRKLDRVFFSRRVSQSRAQIAIMNQLFKLKDTFIEYLSPKRRRTVGPATPSHTGGTDQQSYLPASEPRDERAKEGLGGRTNQKYLSPSDTRFARGSRKRPREEDESANDIDYEVSPDESISQVTPVQRSRDDSVIGPASESDTSVDSPEELEITAEEKVQEYLDRQAELALRREAIEEVKAQGGWHPDEIFLFERLSMRSFEEILPANWQIDFPTLPGTLFTMEADRTFINSTCGSSSRGMAR
jgi:hypothetical protein